MNKLTKFQALYVLYLRHESFQSCSWRALAGNYYSRYTFENTLIPIEDRKSYEGVGGNQIDGAMLEREAFKVLFKDIDPSVIGFGSDLFECDLTYIQANLKNNIII